MQCGRITGATVARFPTCPLLWHVSEMVLPSFAPISLPFRQSPALCASTWQDHNHSIALTESSQAFTNKVVASQAMVGHKNCYIPATLTRLRGKFARRDTMNIK